LTCHDALRVVFLDIFPPACPGCRLARAMPSSGQRLPGIVPFNIVILFRGQNYNERGTALLRFIATGEPGR